MKHTPLTRTWPEFQCHFFHIFVFKKTKKLPLSPFFFKGWLTGSRMDCCWVKDVVREGAEREGRNMKALSSHFFSLPSGSPQLLFSLPCSLHLSLSSLTPLVQSLLIVTHPLQSPPTHSCRSLSSPSSLHSSLLSIHTNDSVKQVKCYKIPPEAQPA